uniref:Uncharacterized protein n=1 Tax=Arundo donax TaxID=35708 RepID=A0A0A9CH65_ARUDO
MKKCFSCNSHFAKCSGVVSCSPKFFLFLLPPSNSMASFCSDSCSGVPGEESFPSTKFHVKIAPSLEIVYTLLTLPDFLSVAKNAPTTAARWPRKRKGLPPRPFLTGKMRAVRSLQDTRRNAESGDQSKAVTPAAKPGKVRRRWKGKNSLRNAGERQI